MVRHSPMYSGFLNLFTVVHFMSMAGLSAYGLHRLWMIWCRFRIPPASIKESNLPLFPVPGVTVQIPLYQRRPTSPKT